MAEANNILAQSPTQCTARERMLVMVLARHAAQKEVKRQLWARGIKLHSVPYRQIVEAARSYLRDHPELIAQTVERVRTTPELWALISPPKRKPRRTGHNLSHSATS